MSPETSTMLNDVSLLAEAIGDMVGFYYHYTSSEGREVLVFKETYWVTYDKIDYRTHDVDVTDGIDAALKKLRRS